MLDAEGFVTEATTANVLVYFQNEGLVSPPRHKVLPGISLMVIAALAAQAGVPLLERDIHPDEVSTADELLLMSTSPCLLPVVEFNGAAIGESSPGPVYRRLLRAWGERVGVDLVAQASRFAVR